MNWRPMITMIEGSSIDPGIVAQARSAIGAGETVLFLLDSNHTKDHVMAELKAYAPLVSVGSYIVATDGIMEQVAGGPRTKPDWKTNNPRQAALEFVSTNPDFAIDRPARPFQEGVVDEPVTYWPDGIHQTAAVSGTTLPAVKPLRVLVGGAPARDRGH